MLATMSMGAGPLRRATRFDLVLEQGTNGAHHVVHQGKIVYSSQSRTLADAHFELLRDELQAATGEDPLARVRAEQAFRDIVGVRGEANRRRTARESEKGGKGGRGGT